MDLATQIGTHIILKWKNKTSILVQSSQSKWPNTRRISRDVGKELVALINDPTLAKFAIEPSKYSLEQTVSIVKRVKAWGRR